MHKVDYALQPVSTRGYEKAIELLSSKSAYVDTCRARNRDSKHLNLHQF